MGVGGGGGRATLNPLSPKREPFSGEVAGGGAGGAIAPPARVER